jgi:hypothetical protein
MRDGRRTLSRGHVIGGRWPNAVVNPSRPRLWRKLGEPIFQRLTVSNLNKAGQLLVASESPCYDARYRKGCLATAPMPAM